MAKPYKMSKLTAAYLAGLIDGEGYIGLLREQRGEKKNWHSARKYRYIPNVNIAMTDRKIIEWLYSSFGGTIETRKAHGNARESYAWMMRKFQVIQFLKIIYPYSKAKKRHIELIMQFPLNKAGHPITDECYNKREEICWAIRKLNKRGVK